MQLQLICLCLCFCKNCFYQDVAHITTYQGIPVTPIPPPPHEHNIDRFILDHPFIHVSMVSFFLDIGKQNSPNVMQQNRASHYENLPMQDIEIFFSIKNLKFHQNSFDIFLIFAQNIDCGYTLEPPRRGGSNEYPQSMFWSKNKKNRYTSAYPSIAI